MRKRSRPPRRRGSRAPPTRRRKRNWCGRRPLSWPAPPGSGWGRRRSPRRCRRWRRWCRRSARRSASSCASRARRASRSPSTTAPTRGDAGGAGDAARARRPRHLFLAGEQVERRPGAGGGDRRRRPPGRAALPPPPQPAAAQPRRADRRRRAGAGGDRGGGRAGDRDYRPPYGIFSAAGLRAMRRRGWRPVLWSLWGRDWDRGRRRARSPVARPPAPGPGTSCFFMTPTTTARATPGCAPRWRCRGSSRSSRRGG